MFKTNDGQGVRVLLCDDQLIVAQALRELLAESTMDIVFEHLADPRTILQTLDSFKPTVVLQDLVLPHLSGIDVLKLVRNETRFRDLPIILLSTNEDAKTKYEAFAAGASDYVVKFPERFELLGRIGYHSRAYRALVARDEAQKQLEQRSRLESLGNLAAGIAHEINTPLQYIAANLSYIEKAITSVKTPMLDEAESLELRAAVGESIEGINEISSIVRAMKAFAHPGKAELVMSSFNELAKDVKVLSRNEWRDCASVILELDESLPPIPCLPGGIAQVLLNLVVNAAQAIQAKCISTGELGEIIIRTRYSSGNAVVEVQDNGGGIPSAIQEKVFDPFFTTKDIGVGSGQGLSIARGIIEKGHQGTLSFTSSPGVGTRFTITVPQQSAQPEISEVVC